MTIEIPISRTLITPSNRRSLLRNLTRRHGTSNIRDFDNDRDSDAGKVRHSHEFLAAEIGHLLVSETGRHDDLFDDDDLERREGVGGLGFTGPGEAFELYHLLRQCSDRHGLSGLCYALLVFGHPQRERLCHFSAGKG